MPRVCCPQPPGLASNAIFGFLAHMDENTGAAQKDPRKERLAKALRDNLKRRKAQARAQASQRAAGSDPLEQAGPVSDQVSNQVSGQLPAQKG
jgi:hypothetical protein